MANGKFLVGKPSGGVTTVTVTDGATNTNLILPESGTVSGVTTAVTDNAIARYNGTTGALQNSGVTINDANEINAVRFVSTNSGVDAQLLSFGIESRLISRGTSDLSNKPLAFLTGTTEACRIDTSGNLLLTSGTGALGYGTGAGGTVTQLTSKSTAVTLNKPSGQITMNNAALAAGSTVVFILINSTISSTDTVSVDWNNANYRVTPYGSATGSCAFIVQNVSAGSLSDALAIQFNIIKGATA